MKPLIIANWKSNFTEKEAKDWLENFKNYKGRPFVICSPFTLLDFLHSYIRDNDLPVKIGAQNISAYEEGPFTGEVTGREIKEFAEYVLVGHSERRRLFNEMQDEIANKLLRAQENNLTSILCISDLGQLEEITPVDDLVIAFEPVEAIGTKNPSSISEVETAVIEIKKKINAPVLYGGSVDADNVSRYTKKEMIDGVLVGGESLVAKDFLKLLENV